MPDLPANPLHLAIERAFDSRDEMDLLERIPIVEAMSEVDPSSQGMVLREFETLGRDPLQDPLEQLGMLRLLLLATERGEIEAPAALDLAARAVTDLPAEAGVRVLAVRLLALAERDEEAMRHLQAAIELDPALAESSVIAQWQGALHYNVGRHQEAARAYERAVRLHPTAAGEIGWGDALRQLGNGKAANRHYQRALRRDPRSQAALVAFRATSSQPARGILLNALRRRLELDLLIRGSGQRVRERLPLSIRLLRRRRVRALARWRLRASWRRRPERLEICGAEGFLALLDGQFEHAEEMLGLYGEDAAPRDPLPVALAALAAIYAGDADKSRLRLERLRSLASGGSETTAGTVVDRALLDRLVVASVACEPALATVAATAPQTISDLWGWRRVALGQEEAERALRLPLHVELKAPRVRVFTDGALVAAGPIVVGEARSEGVRLMLGESAEHSRRWCEVMVLLGEDAVNLRWVSGDLVALRGRGSPLEAVYVRIPIGAGGEGWRLDRGEDLRAALASMLIWW